MQNIQTLLEWAYSGAVDGLPGLGTAQELAAVYESEGNTTIEKVEALIRWQTTKAATTGFVLGLGGGLTLPVTISADIAIVIVVQLRMITAIAHLSGYDLRDERVKTMCYVCLCGNSAMEVLKAGGMKIASRAFERLPMEIIKRINQSVSVKVAAKAGQSSYSSIVRLIPIAGGIVSATFDASSTMAIGQAAKQIFLAKRIPLEIHTG